MSKRTKAVEAAKSIEVSRIQSVNGGNSMCKKMKQTMLVKAVKVEGGYVLDADGCKYYDSVQTSRAACYKDAEDIWPYASTWQGHKVKGGYQITLD